MTFDRMPWHGWWTCRMSRWHSYWQMQGSMYGYPTLVELLPASSTRLSVLVIRFASHFLEFPTINSILCNGQAYSKSPTSLLKENGLSSVSSIWKAWSLDCCIPSNCSTQLLTEPLSIGEINSLVSVLQAYWEWSWDELVAHDMPAVLQHVRSLTGQNMHYVGHSLVNKSRSIFASSSWQLKIFIILLKKHNTVVNLISGNFNCAGRLLPQGTGEHAKIGCFA